MRNPFANGVTIRSALLVGFGVTVSLWLFAGYQVALRLQQAQRDALAVNARYLKAQELLASVRTQVLVASVLVRDALLDPEAGSVSAHRQEIRRAYDSIDRQLAGYVPFVGSPAERERVGRLRDEIRNFRIASDGVLATDISGWPRNAALLLRRFMPRREAAIRVSEEIQTLNRSAFVDQQRTITAMQTNTQRQMWTVFGMALAISLAIGWLAFRHSTRLEGRLHEQRGREERIATDLQRLSARLLHAQEDEQRRIARELHDELGQTLSAVKVELAYAQRRLQRLGGGADLLSDAQSSADTALRCVRDLAHMLHQSSLDDLGLVAALEPRLSDFQRRHGVAVDFTHEGMNDRQSADIERAVYRVVQEALTNVARHSQARAVRVLLSADESACRLLVEDDGVGFDVADAERPGRRHGLGLLGIRERVSQLRGTVTIESGPAGGTRIQVVLPRVDPPAATAKARESPAESRALAHAPEGSHG